MPRGVRLAALLASAVLVSSCRVRHGNSSKAPPIAISWVEAGSEMYSARLLRGFHADKGGWRWVEPSFAVLLDPPDTEGELFVELEFTLPVEISKRFPNVTLAARVNGVEVGRRSYSQEGRYWFAAPVSKSVAYKARPAVVEFEADREFTDAATGERRSIIVVKAALHEYEQTEAYRVEQAAVSRKAFAEVVDARRKTIPREKYLDLLKLYHELPVWRSLHFLNVEIYKNPLDLWVMQQIIFEEQPDFVIETGTFKGGSALYWAYTLNALGLKHSRVLTVDIGRYCQAASTHPLWKQYVEFYLGDSTDPHLVSRIAERVRGKKTLVTLDSDHSMVHVLKELRMYGPLVSRGSYLVVEDTHIDGVPTYPDQGLGPFTAVRRFLAEGGSREFEVDETREALLMTFNPGGWLRRK